MTCRLSIRENIIDRDVHGVETKERPGRKVGERHCHKFNPHLSRMSPVVVVVVAVLAFALSVAQSRRSSRRVTTFPE